MKKIVANIGKLVVKPTPPKTTTPGGIVLPESLDNDTQTGFIVSVGYVTNKDGAGCYNDSFFNVGNLVIFKNYSTSIELNGEKLLVVNKEDILAKVEDNE